MNQMVGHKIAEAGLLADGRAPFPYTHPSQLADNLFIIIHDMDGTAKHTYDAMLIPHHVRRDFPELVKNAVIPVIETDAGQQSAERLISAFFDARFEGKEKGTDVCRLVHYYQRLPHALVLHEPVKALKRVFKTMMGDLEAYAAETGLPLDASARAAVRNGYRELKKGKYAHHVSMAHSLYEDFLTFLEYCRAEQAQNSMCTNTGATFAMNRLMDARDVQAPYAQLEPGDLRLVYAKGDESLGFGVKWDGTAGDEFALTTWLAKNGYVPPEQSMRERNAYLKQACAFHAQMRCFSGNKPTASPIKEIIETLRPDIEERINVGLRANGYEGPAFQLTWKNVLMVGESPSDFGCTADTMHNPKEVKEPGYYQRLGRRMAEGEVPRLARFAWQGLGTLQHPLACETDTDIRGSRHLDRWQACQHAHDMEGLSDIVLPRGYSSLLELARRGRVRVGLDAAKHLLATELILLRDTAPEVWRQQVQRRWQAGQGAGRSVPTHFSIP